MDEICSVYCEDLGKTYRVITESNRAWLWPLIMFAENCILKKDLINKTTNLIILGDPYVKIYKMIPSVDIGSDDNLPRGVFI